jgi:prepilin-type processing-associated H-X9-DG protein
MTGHRRSLTLIETGVVTVVVALGGTILTAGLNRTAEDARSAKCLDNLRRVMNAISAYTVDYGGVLPGPLHPAIIRGAHDLGDLPGDSGLLGEADKRKSLTWLLRPYFPPVGDSATDPSTPNPIVDAVFTCPTAQMVAPDGDFYSSGQILNRPYNYAINSWGPQFIIPGQPYTSDQRWFHTDPPLYFGAWYYLEPEAESEEAFFRGGMWKPKRLSTIPNPGAEYAVGDAWYRRVTQVTRRGLPRKREYLGVYPPQNSGSPLPSGPLHHVAFGQVRSHRRQGVGVLPAIDFDGRTNLAYFDGHVASFQGNWQEFGDGGTVNPFWEMWGGEH